MLKKLINISILVLSMLSITNCSSPEKNNINKENLKGAFDIKFGDTFEVNRTRKKISINNVQVFKINPIKKIKFFDKYYVETAPKTNKISKIYAEKIYKEFTECSNAFDSVWGLLNKKYGVAKYKKIKHSNTGAVFIFFQNGEITLSDCSVNDNKLKIRYSSAKYSDIKNEEKLNLIKNKDAL